jgi:hypothetical protein
MMAAMSIFAIISQPNTNTPKLAGALEANFKGAYIAVEGGGAWLVSATGTTAQQMSEKLGVTSGVNGAAIIVEVASYFGRANPNIWSWIKANWDAPKSG